MFKSPPVMMIHCALSTQLIQRIAGSLPYVLTGDFNIKPDSSMYQLLTEGKVEGDADMPKTREGENWSPIVKPMRSAYKALLGREPEFTNYAKCLNDEPFVGTLDYVFVSPEWAVKDVEKLPSLSEMTGPLPIATEPSDHLLVAATLELK
jgi:endonuclease/exonuclease/phosphatase family metal-dependent hydrolase